MVMVKPNKTTSTVNKYEINHIKKKYSLSCVHFVYLSYDLELFCTNCLLV